MFNACRPIENKPTGGKSAPMKNKYFLKIKKSFIKIIQLNGTRRDSFPFYHGLYCVQFHYLLFLLTNWSLLPVPQVIAYKT
jgi:hypothetical protein